MKAIFECPSCDYATSHRGDWNKHIQAQKHRYKTLLALYKLECRKHAEACATLEKEREELRQQNQKRY